MHSIANIKITTIHVCNKQPQALFFLHSSNFPMVALIEIKLDMQAYYSFQCRLHVSMTTTYCLTNPQAKLLLHSSNFLTVARMEVKLGVHVYYIVPMTTTTTNSLKITSLLKPADCRGKTWCAYVLHRFHDYHNNNQPQALFFFTPQTC